MNTTAYKQTPVPPDFSGPRALTPGCPPRTIITRDGERALRAELELLRRELGGGLAERLREARAFGAPATNDEYLQIQEEEVVMAVRAARLDELLQRAEVVDGSSLEGRVAVGTVVSVKDIESGKLEEHEIVGGHEGPRANAASASSPIGEALIDRTIGAVVEVHLPKGRRRRLQILQIRSVDQKRPSKVGAKGTADVQERDRGSRR
jgi:transcription elongation factor GreA